MKLKSIKHKIVKKAPAILTVAAIVGTVGAVVSAVKRKPVYDRLIEEKQAEKKDGEKVTKKEVAVAAMKAYWPTLILIAVSGACAIGSNVIFAKRVTEYAAVAASTKKVYDEYREAAEKHLKPKAKEEVGDDIAKARMEKAFETLTPESKIPQMMEEVNGPKSGEWQYMCDIWSGQIFWGERNTIEKGFNDFNSRYILQDHHDYIALSWLYDELKIPINDKIENLKHHGWAYDHKKALEYMWVTYPITTGPLQGKIVWGFQLRPGSEPLDVDA